MIHKLYKLYEIIPADWFGEENPLNLNLSYDKGNIALIKIDKNKDEFVYSGVQIDEYECNKNYERYLFEDFSKLPGSNSTPNFPVYRIYPAAKNDPDELFEKGFNKIIKSLQNNTRTKGIAPVLTGQKDQIKSYIFNHLKMNEPYLLSIMIDNKYLAQSEYFRDFMNGVQHKRYDSYYTLLEGKKNIPYTGENKQCNLCKTEKESVWGYVSTFNFYAVKTELAPIAGGFNNKIAWKNYPVCGECAVKLEKAKEILKTYFSFNFYGMRYYLLPEFLIHDEKNEEILEIFKDVKFGTLPMDKEKRKHLTEGEDEVLDLLCDSDNRVNYTLFFYEVNNQEFKILISIDNVFPSRFKEIFNAKESIENYELFPFFCGLPGGKGKPLWDLRFTFGIIRNFFPKSKKDGDFTRNFLEITRSVFLGNKIDYNFIINRIMTIIRTHYANNENYTFDLLKGIMLTGFLNKLELFKNKQTREEKEVDVENKYEDFFKKHPDFFDNNTKKAIFLEGVLCQLLLNIQHNDRGATPFRSRLNGLKLNEKIIKRLLPEMIEKLEQYGKNYYVTLEQSIASYLLNASFDMSNDEISFYFVMGMCLYKEFKTES